MNPNHLEVPVQVRLAALWASTMFLYVYVDILSLYKPGTVRDILRGRVWEFEITQGWALGALALMTIPSVMIALSVLLPTKANQRTNMSGVPVHPGVDRQRDRRDLGLHLARRDRRGRAARDDRGPRALARGGGYAVSLS